MIIDQWSCCRKAIHIHWFVIRSEFNSIRYKIRANNLDRERATDGRMNLKCQPPLPTRSKWMGHNLAKQDVYKCCLWPTNSCELLLSSKNSQWSHTHTHMQYTYARSTTSVQWFDGENVDGFAKCTQKRLKVWGHRLGGQVLSSCKLKIATQTVFCSRWLGCES